MNKNLIYLDLIPSQKNSYRFYHWHMETFQNLLLLPVYELLHFSEIDLINGGWLRPHKLGDQSDNS